MPAKVKKLSIETASITIQVVKLDGHKLTKATFNQFQIRGFDENYLSGKFILGWVYDPPKYNYIVFEDDGEIYKMRFPIHYGSPHEIGYTRQEFAELVNSIGISQIYIAT